MAVAAFTQRLNMFQRCVHCLNMRAANPTRHLPMQLARDGVVDFDSGVGEFAHAGIVRLLLAAHAAACPSALLRVPRPLASALTSAERLGKPLF